MVRWKPEQWLKRKQRHQSQPRLRTGWSVLNCSINAMGGLMALSLMIRKLFYEVQPQQGSSGAFHQTLLSLSTHSNPPHKMQRTFFSRRNVILSKNSHFQVTGCCRLNLTPLPLKDNVSPPRLQNVTLFGDYDRVPTEIIKLRWGR